MGYEMLWAIAGIIWGFSGGCLCMYFIMKEERKLKKQTIRRKAIPKADRRRLLDASGGKCSECNFQCCSPHIDHILPVALGGGNEIENLQVLCAACNLRKGAKVRKEQKEQKVTNE